MESDLRAAVWINEIIEELNNSLDKEDVLTEVITKLSTMTPDMHIAIIIRLLGEVSK